ncbi:hypothetical protein M409DRAFT_29516 [Zasmidium cellare ATCC 36951]|uniref:Uncharacterized protein n=1 Tax=Zasmidium cellare ATCC 36951 TaxID=1080233 RepID=A0A6A6C1N8_ZASCE|nr:uncharacterized protein M409DRAFT_29516 [Zasmidium cellare ATCC 36951]KAF2160070.1 hypothetical protein M409DRAFT_29516 [Zasmidium cellare ATCC 36951]
MARRKGVAPSIIGVRVVTTGEASTSSLSCHGESRTATASASRSFAIYMEQNQQLPPQATIRATFRLADSKNRCHEINCFSNARLDAANTRRSTQHGETLHRRCSWIVFNLLWQASSERHPSMNSPTEKATPWLHGQSLLVYEVFKLLAFAD